MLLSPPLPWLHWLNQSSFYFYLTSRILPTSIALLQIYSSITFNRSISYYAILRLFFWLVGRFSSEKKLFRRELLVISRITQALINWSVSSNESLISMHDEVSIFSSRWILFKSKLFFFSCTWFFLTSIGWEYLRRFLIASLDKC